MSKIALIGKKLGMTNVFDNDKVVPVTLLKVLPNVVVDVRNYGNKYGLVLAGNEEIADRKVEINNRQNPIEWFTKDYKRAYQKRR